jgi:hypothetical protein
MALGQAQQPVRAAGQVFMDVGVPGGGQRQIAMIGETCAQHAHFAGAGDVNQVGLKAVQHFAHEGNMPRKCRIEAKIFFQSEGKDAARQFKRPDIAVFDESLTSIARADAEERQVFAAGKGFKMAAGVRNPVDFMEGVGEVRYSG